MSNQAKLRRALARMGVCAAIGLIARTSRAQSAGTINTGAYGTDHYLSYDTKIDVFKHGYSGDMLFVGFEGDYLPQVLQGQIDSAGQSINPEALKAMAIADRSMIYDHRSDDVYIVPNGFAGAPLYDPKLSVGSAALLAARSTAHEIFDNGPLQTFVKLGKPPASVAAARSSDLTLSLNGANYLAGLGWDYQDILHFYYDAHPNHLDPNPAPNKVFIDTIGRTEITAAPESSISPRKILGDFDSSEGILQSAGAPNRFMQNLAHTDTSMAFRSFKSPLQGTASEQVTIKEAVQGNPFVYRMLTGSSGLEGTSQGNLSFDAAGQIGFYLRSTTPNLKTQIAINDGGVLKSEPRRIIADGKWHKYAWGFGSKDWRGIFPGGDCTLNSIYLSGSADADVHIDSVFWEEPPTSKSSPGAGLVKVGSGQLRLTGSNLYIGNTTVNAGTLNISGAAGTISLANLTVNTFGGLTAVGSTTSLTSSGFFTGNSLITNGGVLTSFNIGTLLLNDPSLALSQPSGIPGTVLVPEPAAIGLLIATPAFLHRRRKSEI